MTVPVVETFAVTNVQGTSQALTAAAGIALNDIILILVHLDGDAGNVLSTGFDQFSVVSQGACETFWLRKRATASEPGTYTITWTGNERGRATVIRVSGCPTTGTALDQVDQIGTQADAATGTTIFCPAIVSTVIDTLAFAALTADSTGVQGGDGFTANNNGFTIDGTPGNNGTIAAGGMFGTKPLPSIGDSLSPEFGWTNSEQHVTNMISLIGISAPPTGFAHSQVVIVG